MAQGSISPCTGALRLEGSPDVVILASLDIPLCAGVFERASSIHKTFPGIVSVKKQWVLFAKKNAAVCGGRRSSLQLV